MSDIQKEYAALTSRLNYERQLNDDLRKDNAALKALVQRAAPTCALCGSLLSLKLRALKAQSPTKQEWSEMWVCSRCPE